MGIKNFGIPLQLSRRPGHAVCAIKSSLRSLVTASASTGYSTFSGCGFQIDPIFHKESLLNFVPHLGLNSFERKEEN